jgi:Cu/Zn superoxide dismutase
MKHALIVVASLAASGCGHKASPPPVAPAPPAEEAAPEPPPAPAPPPPPPPKAWHAHAALTPVKGAKLKAATVSFAQTEGETLHVAMDAAFEGLKPGTYHLVIHEAAACGPNATKAGKAWPTVVDVVVAKGANEPLSQDVADLALDGDAAIAGHTLAIHDDKKGKPGKALACGPITADEPDAPADAAALE